jgi:hypothetical protein
MRSKWLLLTAGFGSPDMNAAAERVKSQAISLGIFDRVLAFSDADLETACPDVYKNYREYLSPSHKGFGYFSWKVELVSSALSGKFGDFDGVVWVDAGCEIYNAPWTRWRLRRWLKQTEKKGVFAYTLSTPEQDFTKKTLFNLFPNLNKEDRSPQFQATWFILHGEKGRSIANEWFRIALLNISTLDLSASPGGEVPSFVEHRSEQSILSLILKNKKENSAKFYFPYSGFGTYKSQVIALTNPIWVSRNRSGRSIIGSQFHLKR